MSDQEAAIEIEQLRAENDHFNAENEKAWAEIERLRAERKVTARNEQERLERLAENAREIERLKAALWVVVDDPAVPADVQAIARAALEGKP